MLKQYFVNQGLKEAAIEDFIRKRLPEGNYSRMELQRTPLGIKIIIYSASPGRIIGRGGRTINEMTDALREKFSLENPQLDVKSVANPYLDAKIVAKQIADAIQRGFNFKRVANMMVKKVMDAGAIGIEISIAGRMSGSKASSAKFIEGYLKHSGEPSRTLVDRGYEELYQIGRTEPGKVGIKVKIMREFQTITGELKSSMKELAPPRHDQPSEEVKQPESPAPAEPPATDVAEEAAPPATAGDAPPTGDKVAAPKRRRAAKSAKAVAQEKGGNA